MCQLRPNCIPAFGSRVYKFHQTALERHLRPWHDEVYAKHSVNGWCARGPDRRGWHLVVKSAATSYTETTDAVEPTQRPVSVTIRKHEHGLSGGGCGTYSLG